MVDAIEQARSEASSLLADWAEKWHNEFETTEQVKKLWDEEVV